MNAFLEFKSRFQMNPPIPIECSLDLIKSKGLQDVPKSIIDLFKEFNGSAVLIGSAMWNFWTLDKCFVERIGSRRLFCFCDAYLEAPIYGISAEIGDPFYGHVFCVTYESNTGLELEEFFEKVMSDIDSFVLIE